MILHRERASGRFVVGAVDWRSGAPLRLSMSTGGLAPEHAVNPHRLAEERSIAFHRALGERLVREPALVGRARGRVERWVAEGTLHPTYAAAWLALLALPAHELARQMVDPGEEMLALRQCSPFAGELEPKERWRIWRRVRDETRAS